MKPLLINPAKIATSGHAGLDPASRDLLPPSWIPAYAGMTTGLCRLPALNTLILSSSSLSLLWSLKFPLLKGSGEYITPAIKYLNIVIPAKAGIQEGTGCRIKSDTTELDYLVARLIANKLLKTGIFKKMCITHQCPGINSRIRLQCRRFHLPSPYGEDKSTSLCPVSQRCP